jgi:hypothetical protein
MSQMPSVDRLTVNASDEVSKPDRARPRPADRRNRRRRAGVVAAVLVAAAAIMWSVPVGRLTRVDPDSGSGALPDRVWIPRAGALRVTDPFPLGSAAVLFSGMGTDDAGTVAAVGADTDRYRVLHVGVDAPAGEVVLLSPDGRRLAHQADGPAGPRVDIVDLTDRSVQKVPARAEGSVWTRPLGWSRDSRRLVVIDTVPANPERSAYRNELSLVDLSTGGTVHLATAGDTGSVVPGYAVAFAPDGRTLALQIDDTVMVTNLAGAIRRTFRLPPDTVLAGKGAWTADSRALTVAKRRGDSWTLATVDPATGAGLADLDMPTVSGCSWRMPRPDGCVSAIRLLGWGPDGAALVVAYHPEPATSVDFAGQTAIDQRIAYGHVRTVRLLSLTPGAAAPVIRLTAPDGVRAVDVADGLIAAGRTRVADPAPDRPGPRFWFWLVMPAVVLAAALGFRWYVRRNPGPVNPARAVRPTATA